MTPPKEESLDGRDESVGCIVLKLRGGDRWQDCTEVRANKEMKKSVYKSYSNDEKRVRPDNIMKTDDKKNINS